MSISLAQGGLLSYTAWINPFHLCPRDFSSEKGAMMSRTTVDIDS
ncbi:hypothetical protein [Porphyromonas cangingivalis]|nr:hypothetical protein [Porphyromonas cangingivalis]